MKRTRAFTLVELLVVIGIIALLIGILLPSLAKARAFANRAACLSNLHNMGVSIAGYVGTYKGSLPFGKNLASDNHGINVNWVSLLAQQMGNVSQNADGIGTVDNDKRLGVFICKDAQPNPTGGNPLSTYSCHPLLMPDISSTLGYPTGFPETQLIGQVRRPYKISRIRNSTEIILIFDAAQNVGGQGEAGQPGKNIDKNRISNDDGLNPTSPGVTYLVAGYNGVDLGQSVDGGANVDAKTLAGANNYNIRWRHSGNTVANFLYVDGHAGSLRYKDQTHTELLRRNVYVPAP